MPTLPVVEQDLRRCCLKALAKFDDVEIEGAHLICPKCSNRLRVRDGKWQRWFYWNELPEGHPDRKRDRQDTGPASLAFTDLMPGPNASTETPAALRGDKIPFLEQEE